ncbi:MAG: serine/threonine protein kinase [Clostridiales bacterium]|nr:serine/threonine protein kinase [Clostridiales bacterium]
MICLNCMKTFDEVYGVCPYCGFVPGSPPKEAYHLYPGVKLRDRYLVGTTVGFGGFGITYRAWDMVLQKKVAIKEFYPNGIVNRVPGQKEVIVYSGNRANEFQGGKERFLAEARNMARFNTHPNIVNVYEFFEENNTAYIAMEFLEGMSYKDYIKQHGGKVSVDEAVHVAMSVLDALKEIHKVGIIHRDVSPDNIFLVPESPGSDHYRVKLIDFGAARFSSGEEEKTLSIILKPGYAPPEQYRSRSRQGPWTDIYAVGAVLYRSITGRMPEESVNRVVEDKLAPPSAYVPDLPEYLDNSIMRAMALNQELRFRNVDQFKEAIQNRTKILAVDAELKRRKLRRGICIAGIGLAVIAAGAGCFFVYRGKQQALYGIKASITVEMPDVNAEKASEIEAASAMGAETGEKKTVERMESAEMLGKMIDEYQAQFEKVTINDLKSDVSVEEYRDQLEQTAKDDLLPSVFETTGVTEKDDIWEKLGTLETTYETLNQKDYYFMESQGFQEYFAKDKKQIPISFRAPVFYVNTNLIPEESIPQDVTDLVALVDAEGNSSFCVGSEVRKMYGAAFEGSTAYQELFAKADDDSRGYEPFLERQTAYYLGTTDDYEAVRASLGGIYRMETLETLWREGKICGQFTSLWSIDGSLEGDDKEAADSLVYYFLGENAQDAYNLQGGNGLPLNKNMMKTYAESNGEFQELVRLLNENDGLAMEYGEGQGL